MDNVAHQREQPTPGRIGPHTYSIEGNVVNWRSNGAVLPDHVDQIFDVVVGLIRNHADGCYMLLDAKALSIPSGETRKRVFLRNKENPIGDRVTYAYYNVSWPVRTAITLMMNAVKLATRTPAKLHFAPTEADARRWIDQQRAQRKSG